MHLNCINSRLSEATTKDKFMISGFSPSENITIKMQVFSQTGAIENSQKSKNSTGTTVYLFSCPLTKCHYVGGKSATSL
ncbi:unnamed protein product [Ixodes persulcatus]